MYTLNPDKGNLRISSVCSSNSTCSNLPTDILMCENNVWVRLFIAALVATEKTKGKCSSIENRWNKLCSLYDNILCSPKKKRRCFLLIRNNLQDVLSETKQGTEQQQQKGGNRKKEKMGEHSIGSPFVIHIFTIWSYFWMIYYIEHVPSMCLNCSFITRNSSLLPLLPSLLSNQ